MTKNDRSKVDWTKPLEFQETPGFWVPCNLVYESDKLMIVVYTVGDREYEVTLDAKKKSDPLKNFRNKKESRAVPKDKWLDLTKPLEGYWTKSGECAGPIKYVGQMDDASANFPSWFIVRWEEDCEDSEHFLMRGDGKIDIPGLTVRNKRETVVESEGLGNKKESLFPLIAGRRYRCRNGQIVDLLVNWDGKSNSWCPYNQYDVHTGRCKGYTTISYETQWDIVAGPL